MSKLTMGSDVGRVTRDRRDALLGFPAIRGSQRAVDPGPDLGTPRP